MVAKVIEKGEVMLIGIAKYNLQGQLYVTMF